MSLKQEHEDQIHALERFWLWKCLREISEEMDTYQEVTVVLNGNDGGPVKGSSTDRANGQGQV